MLTLAFAGLLLAAAPARPLLVTVDDLPIASSLHPDPAERSRITDGLLAALATGVRPAVLSLGASRRLWDDARIVPEEVVLFGNLETKHFYSDATLPLEAVRARTREILARMRDAGRPFILGSECDVLHVAGAGETIRAKVEAMLTTEAD